VLIRSIRRIRGLFEVAFRQHDTLSKVICGPHRIEEDRFMHGLRPGTLSLTILGAVLASNPLTAADAPAAPKKITVVEGITEYRLENGLRVLLFPDSSRPTVTINLTVFVGSRHEGYGETGMAHLLEHMVFKGTPTHPHIPKVLQERGARFNGTTWVDRTNYYETLPASDSNLEFAIRLEADRMVNSHIARDDLVSEMTVVRNEFEQGENSPSRILYQRMLATAYEWHNYGKSTIGNRSDIERVPIEKLQAFYRKFYQPDNALLVIAGQFDEKKALDYTQKYFGTLPRPKRELDTTYTEEPAQDGERFVTLRRVGDVGMVGVAYHIPAGPHQDYVAVDVLNQLLTHEPSGRLYKALVESKKASGVSGAAYGWHDPGVLVIQASVRKENSLEEARDALLKVTEEISSGGVTDAEVERARKQLLNDWEQATANSSQLAVQLSNWASQGDWRLYFLYRDRLEKVTPSDVKAVADRYLRRSNRTVGLFIPTTQPERIAVPSTPKVTDLVADYKGRNAIAAGENFDVSPGNIDARTRTSSLPEGVKVALLPKKTRGEVVNVRLTLRYGDEESLKGLVRAANFLPELMARGTKKYSYQQLKDELDKLQAELNVSGDTGTATFTLRTKRENLAAALDLLRQVLREPALKEAELEILRTEELASLERQRTDPRSLAFRLIQRQLNPVAPTDVRYQPTFDEEIQQVKSLDVEQVRKLYQDFLGAHAGEWVIVGDFEEKESLPVVTRITAGWKGTKPYARIPRVSPEKLAGGKQVINTPDKANATYIAGLILPLRDDDPDYAALVIGNHLFGGGSLSSRLGDRVRQKEGLSYGVGSSFNASALDRRASLVIFAICNPVNMTKVETAIREELDKLLKEGISEEELARAKQGYLQQQQVNRTSDTQLASTLSECLQAGRTMTHHADLEKKIAALTPAQVTDTVRKHLAAGKLFIVTAGDFEKKPSEGGK
jgi:zinc protease